MRNCFSWLRIASLILLVSNIAIAQQMPEEMDLYLLIGQSNMAGRGEIVDDGNTANSNVWVINVRNEWVSAKDPLHYDKPSAGVGPGLIFGETLHARNPERPIGLIPCAVGGSGIDDWVTGKKHDQTGIYAYDAMLERVRVAKENGTLRGILWHQGESDSSPEKSNVYEKKLSAFFKNLRKEIGAKKLPVILGTLGDFYVAKNREAAKINQILTDYAAKNKHVYIITSAGLTDLGDQTHFNTESARELGKRYAAKMIEITN